MYDGYFQLLFSLVISSPKPFVKLLLVQLCHLMCFFLWFRNLQKFVSLEIFWLKHGKTSMFFVEFFPLFNFINFRFFLRTHFILLHCHRFICREAITQVVPQKVLMHLMYVLFIHFDAS